ncbi:MAG: amidohydrolase [Chromatiales bacterium]|jgi:amidohydrolase|nr:amidohydrolase [Chromatiales bacterium]
MTIDDLKVSVCAAIDRNSNRIIDIGETILRHPETGFKEHRTAAFVADKMREAGLSPETGLAVTGLKARVERDAAAPTMAILGELDSLCIPAHPFADEETGAAHACGHNAQIAGMLGTAIGLMESGAREHLGGNLVFMAVPAEEMIEVDFRLGLREKGEIEFLTGKAEMIRLGHFDDVDLALMCHTKNDKTASHVANSSNGAIIKRIRFLGKSAHAGASPQRGINALNAATLAMTAIALQRETFYDSDTIRIHPIITRGGDAVSAVPAEVTMETFVRGRTLEGIIDANRKVDRCLKAAAMAIGCQVEIDTTAGYLPQNNDRTISTLWGENVKRLYGDGHFTIEEHRTGSTDMGDLGHLMPVSHPYIYGATGVGHGADYILEDKQSVYINMSKLLAMTVVDLLYGDAAPAREIMDASRPKLTKDEYLAFNRDLNGQERFSADELLAAAE